MKGIIQNLTKLEELVLDGVNMSTLAPGHLTNLTSSLMLLSLGNCRLQGSFPENIFHRPNLHALKLQGNDYLKCNFSKVDGSSSLRYLDVSYTSFSEKLPSTIGNLKLLSHLKMAECNFIGPVPMSIGNLTQLSYLDLGDNNLSGHVPSFLSNLEQLIVLDLSLNNFSGEISDIFINLTQLSSLDLSYNRLSGPIPDIFISLTQLSSLDLSGNSLSGPIPSGVGGLRNLASVSLQTNSLNGTIPSELFNLPSLEIISLGGGIEQLQWKDLQHLNLHSNLLQGLLSAVVLPPLLLFFIISDINMTGTIPSSFAI
ncbi:hypothetical protein LWI28_015152 [Acer negundo]|uniref:Disease resistance R13L4/SHOC-2-like LRR domain-containing protein n=1 Tax=Acer negundo TaxID=4023 RepID=A0AAD5J4W6_ACENE|nr:hypothetical protein LWI28_015152 [Acer negundo]